MGWFVKAIIREGLCGKFGSRWCSGSRSSGVCWSMMWVWIRRGFRIWWIMWGGRQWGCRSLWVGMGILVMGIFIWMFVWLIGLWLKVCWGIFSGVTGLFCLDSLVLIVVHCWSLFHMILNIYIVSFYYNCWMWYSLSILILHRWIHIILIFRQSKGGSFQRNQKDFWRDCVWVHFKSQGVDFGRTWHRPVERRLSRHAKGRGRKTTQSRNKASLRSKRNFKSWKNYFLK